MERPGKPLSDAAFAMIVPGAEPEGRAARGRPKAVRAERTDGFESAQLRQRSLGDVLTENLSPGSSPSYREDRRGVGRLALQPPGLSEAVNFHSEGSGQGSPRHHPDLRSTTGRFKFLPEKVPLFPSARARANTNAPNADEEDAPDFIPDSPRTPCVKTKRSPKAKAAFHSSFYLDRQSKPKPRMPATSEDLNLLTIQNFGASKEEPKDELPSPSSSMRRAALQDLDSSDVQKARRLSQLVVRGWTNSRKDKPDSTSEGYVKEEEEQESPVERLLRLQKQLQEALEMQARGYAIELKAMSIAEEKEMLELESLIDEHGLTGRAALAYVLCAKLGSLDDSFNYLDSNSAESFAAVSWHTGLMILRIDLPKIAGIGKQQMFSSITKGGTTVSREAWREYFAGVEDALPPLPGQRKPRRLAITKPKAPVMEAPAPKPKEPEKKHEPEPPKPEEKKEEVPKSSGWGKLRAAAKKIQSVNRIKLLVEEQPPQESKEEDEEAFTERVTNQLQGLSPDESVKLLNLSRKHRAICLQVARANGLWSSTQGSSLLVLREGPFTEQVRKDIANLPLASGLRLLVSKIGPGLVLLGRTLTDVNGMHMSKAAGKCPSCCEELSMPAESPASRSLMDFAEEDGYDVDIFNDQGTEKEIQAAVEAQLTNLAVDAMFDYPAAAGQDFRTCVGKFCDSHGFEATGIRGFQERLVVGNLAKSMSKLHEDLSAVDSSGTVEFKSDISRLQKEAIRREARLKGYTIVEDETGLKVSRMSILIPVSAAEQKRRSIQQLCQLSGQVFDKYATGGTGTSQTYMRRNDLLDMVKDGSGKSDALAEGLKKAYDDTLHLQVEVTKASNGLSKQFFKVFLDKAMQEAGWYPSPEILEALHEKSEMHDGIGIA